MAEKDAVQSWWDGLSTEDQDDVLRSRDAGQPSERMQQSMEEAGLVEQGSPGIPDHVLQHLAEQERGTPGGPPEGGKMRH